MEFEPMNKTNFNDFDESINLRQFFEKYFSNIKWFGLSILICMSIAFFKIRYETPNYNVTASILIKDQNKGGSVADLSVFEDLGLFGSNGNTLENELEFLKSRRLIAKVVKELKLNIKYFIEDSPRDYEVYPNFPIYLDQFSDSVSFSNVNSFFYLEVIDNKKFEIFNNNEMSLGKKSFDEEFIINLGDDDRIENKSLKILLNKNYFEDIKDKRIKIVINPIDKTVNNLMDRIEVELPPDVRYSKILKLSINESIIGKGEAILNNLIEQYNADGINDKDEVSLATTEFLDDRLILLSSELEAIEVSAAQFKTNKRMVDTESGTNIYLESSSITERNMVKANTELQLVDFMIEELDASKPGELLPGNIGLSDNIIIRSVNDYNQLQLKRNRILKSSSEKNPIVVNLDSELDVLRQNLYGNLMSLRTSTIIEIEALSKQSGNISSKIASVPKYEKEYKDIVRGQETKNALYLFLLQKREESILSNAVKIEKAKIVDSAFSNGRIVSPNKKIMLLGALIIGLFIPFVVIYLKDILDTKIHTESDLEKLGIPFLGDIPFSKFKNQLIVNEGNNNSIAEAFRYARTNIGFLLDNKKYGNTILVTSTKSGEGKTFASINLARSLAISGKKTLLIGLDLRAPKISTYLNMKKGDLGVSNFIKNSDLRIEDILKRDNDVENLHVINTGDIPPNPVELLMHDRVVELFNTLKQDYEYIIVDSAPVGLVTDTVQVAHLVDLTIYLIKANSIDKRMLHIPHKLFVERKLINMAFLINATDHGKGAYGYGYGYGIKKKNSWRSKYNSLFNDSVKRMFLS